MAQNPPGYPPVPPGGYPPAPGGATPQPYGAAGASAAERALEDWASARGYALRSSPDVAWYQGWWPFQYAFRLARLGRELRAQFAEVSLFLVEAFEADELKRVSGEDRHLYAFMTSPKLTARVAIRAKSGGGALDDLSRGINSLFAGGANAGSVLGDPTFEQRFEVTAPSRAEGDHALPLGLRHMLVNTGWRGILETRAGGMLVIPYDRRSFDAPTLEAVIGAAGQIYHLAVAR